ncbi:VCBS repeat-containing protein [candidate division KSB1 bacterium]|nr:VCBS repeat-containing protein [candidate division KSB1 bacterium]
MDLKLRSLVILGILFFAEVFGQNSWHKVDGPYGGLVHPLAIDENDQLYAVFNNTLSTSTDQGRTWREIFANTATFRLGLDSYLYAESLDSGLYFSQDRGATWTLLPATIDHLTLDKMAVARDGTLFFADGDQLYVSFDRALRWTPAASSIKGNASFVCVSELDHLYVFGNEKLFFADNNPDSLKLVLQADDTIQTVLENSRGDIFVSVAGNTLGSILKSTDGGGTWTRTSLPFAQSLHESPQGWLLGASAARPGNSFISTNGGASWNAVNINMPIYSFVVSTNGKIYAASDGLFVSNNSGGSFTNISPSSAAVFRVISDAKDRLFCITGIDKRYSRFWYADAGATSWTEIDKKNTLGQPLTFFDARFVADDRLWLLLGYGADAVSMCKLYESRDGGRTWSAKRTLNAGAAGFDVDRQSGTIYFWGQGEKYSYRTDDFGASWIPAMLPFEIGALHAASDGLVFGYSAADARTVSRLYRSFNKGDKWDDTSTPIDDGGIANLHVDRFGHVYKLTAVERDGTFHLSSIWKSGDYALNYSDVTPSAGVLLEPSTTMFTMFSDANGALYVRASHAISITRDNGNSWNDIYSSATAAIHCVHSTNSVDVYIGSMSAGILKTEQPVVSFKPRMVERLEMPAVARTYGVNWVDYDADGFDDLFLVNEGPNILYRNNRDGTFKRITAGSIVTDDEDSRSATWGDYNDDGYPDCFVANSNKTHFNSLYRNNGDGTFKKITSGNIVEDYGDYRGCAWVDVDNDGDLDLYVTGISDSYRNILYLNDGTNHFTKSQDAVIGELSDKTYNCGWADFDNDGDLDVYLANEGDDRLFEQVRPGQFVQLNSERIATNSGAAVSCSWGDYDNDGYVDLFVANYNAANCLYHNNRGRSFTKITAPGISTDAKISKGSGWADYDNDGDLDLFVCNRNSFLFYVNDGYGNFTQTAGQFFFHAGNSLSLAWGDAENDGDLDLAIASYDQQTLIYENILGMGNWLKIKCVGNNAANRSAIGATIKVVTTSNNQRVMQTRHISSQTGHAAQNSLIAHFGLGSAAKVDSIIIGWPSANKRQVLAEKSANQKITVVETASAAVDAGPHRTAPRAFLLLQNYPNPFNPSTTIRFDLPEKTHVQLVITDVRGRLVKTLLNDATPAGSYAIQWHGDDEMENDVASGLYFYRIQTARFAACAKMTLLR